MAALQQTHLIAASSHAEQQESREWYYYPGGGASGHGAPAGGEEGRAGPVSKAEIRQLYRWVHRRVWVQLQQKRCAGQGDCSARQAEGS